MFKIHKRDLYHRSKNESYKLSVISVFLLKMENSNMKKQYKDSTIIQSLHEEEDEKTIYRGRKLKGEEDNKISLCYIKESEP